MTADWWREAVVYQIYPRSFADSNGDGIGDLAGITSRVGYLADLGVDAVWLSPFYPSALADGGYDVDDYRDIDPRIGTLDDFTTLVSVLHARGMRVMIDIVPNHTSDRHRWFRQALADGPGSTARGRYHFRDGRGPCGDQPPTSWTSIFGGPAWHRVTEFDGSPGQWYFHYFAPEQPDLNWDRADVRDDFVHTLRFWSDRGVDGFRIDVAFMLTKDMDAAPHDLADIHGTEHLFPEGRHPLFDRDDVQDVYAQWRSVFEEYEPARCAVAEAWVPAHRRVRYASPTSLGQAFNFDLLRAPFDAAVFRDVIGANLALANTAGSTSTWVLSNHDSVRHATRYGLPTAAGTDVEGKSWLAAGGNPDDIDTGTGLRRARAATVLLLGLPGSVYLYQGEELGLPEAGQIPAVSRQDPIFRRSRGQEIGRDGARVPLPWSPEAPSFGFGDGTAHIPQPSWFGTYAVNSQAEDPDSTLSLYRRTLRLRREMIAGRFAWVDSPDDIVHFTRGGRVHVVANMGDDPIRLPVGEVVVSSGDVSAGHLAPEATAWIVTDPHRV